MSEQRSLLIEAFEHDVDRACERAIEHGLTNEEVAKELERLAQGWRDAM